MTRVERIKHCHRLTPMAMEARKPIFLLTPAEGAVGAHQANVQQRFADFRSLVEEIAKRASIVRGGGASAA